MVGALTILAAVFVPEIAAAVSSRQQFSTGGT
jgi:hypothetical protein